MEGKEKAELISVSMGNAEGEIVVEVQSVLKNEQGIDVEMTEKYTQTSCMGRWDEIYETTPKERKNVPYVGTKTRAEPSSYVEVKLLKGFEGQPKNFGFYNVNYYKSLKVLEAISGYFIFKVVKYKIVGTTT